MIEMTNVEGGVVEGWRIGVMEKWSNGEYRIIILFLDSNFLRTGGTSVSQLFY